VNPNDCRCTSHFNSSRGVRLAWFLFAALLTNAPLRAVDEEQTLPRGLMLTLTSTAPDDAADAKDTQWARMVALHIPKGQRGSPFLPGPAHHARWDGFINVGLRGRYTFSVEGRGRFTLTINGNRVLESGDETDLAKLPPVEKVRLNKGGNAIVVEYEWQPGEEASLRLYWQSDEFPREPVPPMAFTHDPKNEFLALGMKLREGRELFATMRCVKCHTTGDLDKAVGARMPELASDAPTLTDAGVRLGMPWMAHWIQNPKHFRADATMPRLTGPPMRGVGGGELPSAEAWHIAAYLDSLGQKAPPAKRPPDSKETIAAGGHLFASLGCIGCHTLPTHSDEKTIDSRVPLKWVRHKWQRDAVPAFLMNPQAHYAWNRMPNFRLTEDEARQITAFLWSQPAAAIKPEQPSITPDAKRGGELVQSLGCLNCHEIKVKDAKLENKREHPPLAVVVQKVRDQARGCLVDREPPARHLEGAVPVRAPLFEFAQHQSDAIRAFLATQVTSLDRDTPVEFASRQLRLAQCNACHKRDGDNDRWSNHEGEVASLIIKPAAEEMPKPADDFDDDDPSKPKEAQIDQSRPELTHIGEKLRPQWMEQFIAGKLDYKLRPWITARMPAFPARAHWLAQGFAMEHGFAPVAGNDPEPDLEMAAIGKQLVGRSIDGKAGFACVQCHAIGKKPAENVFEAQGINFAYSKERLRPEYYMRWMLKPARAQPGTRMPAFALEDGTTPFTEVLGGDARKQFDTIWQYLLLGREITPP